MMCPLISMARLTPGLCPSYTFQQVQEHTDQIWKFQRHDLIEEYHGRPPAPPPFILLNHLQILVRQGLLRRPALRHKQLSEDQHVPSCPFPPPQGMTPCTEAQGLVSGLRYWALGCLGIRQHCCPLPLAEEKLEKNEEAALLSWEMYLKENYLQHQQCQEKQNTEQKIRDIAQRYL